MDNNRLKYGTFATTLLTEVPEFQAIYDKHLAENDELLLHVLMGDFVRFLFEEHLLFVSNQANSNGNLRWERIIHKSLNLMEEGIVANDPKVRNLVSVSFVKNLRPDENEGEAAYETIKAFLRPYLREELEYYYPD